MQLSIRRWRPSHLFASWTAYWVGLAAVTLAPTARAVWRATRLPDGGGTISAAYDNGLLNVTVVERGVQTFAAAAPFGSAVLWIVGPPLALWLVWLAVRERRTAPNQAVRGASRAERMMPGASPSDEWPPRPDDRVPVERVHTPDPSPGPRQSPR
jgi:hypothetical protein